MFVYGAVAGAVVDQFSTSHLATRGKIVGPLLIGEPFPCRAWELTDQDPRVGTVSSGSHPK